MFRVLLLLLHGSSEETRPDNKAQASSGGHVRDNGNQSLLNICSFKDSVNINPEKFARECDSRPSPTSLCLVLGVRACTCVRACVLFCFLHALLCIQLTFAAQNHPKKRRQGTARGGVGRVGCMCQKSSQKTDKCKSTCGGRKKKKKYRCPLVMIK